MTSAVEKLQQSHLSDQTELLKDDLSIDTLYLWQDGRKTNADIAPLLIGQPSVERTIDGASSVRLPVTDVGRELLNSGLISKRCDIEIDDLWFRLVQVNLPDFASVELVFEDREVAILREYPKPDAPHHGFKVWDPTKMTRLEVAKWLVEQPGRARELEIGFLAPGYGLGDPGNGPSPQANVSRSPGFGPHPHVTVKDAKASKRQLGVIDTILRVGVNFKSTTSDLHRKRKGVGKAVLVMAVMVATAESGCGSNVGHDPHAVGVFQQNPDYWPATGDVAKDARGVPGKHGFFEVAQGIYENSWQPSLAAMCATVQGNAGGAATYQPWEKEATKTVTEWLGQQPIDANAGGTNPVFTSTGGRPFTRGRKQAVNGKVVYTREDNWACLQRLAHEVGWRCFCSSGIVYFATDDDLIHSAPIHTVTESLDWIDEITGQLAENLKPRRSAFVTKKSYAQMTVKCRIHRWKATPGSCVEVADLGPFNGRWIVSSIQRPLLNNNGTIIIKKPQPALPESLSPELRQVGGVQVFVPSGGNSNGGFIDAGAIVAAATKALVNRDDYRYLQTSTMPASLFGKPVPKYIDCSVFVTLVYKAAYAADPSGFGYRQRGNTLTLWDHGAATKTPKPGDLVFWTSDPSGIPVAGNGSHVGVYIGSGEYIAMGTNSVYKDKVANSPSPGDRLAGYRTYRQPKPRDRKGVGGSIG